MITGRIICRICWIGWRRDFKKLKFKTFKPFNRYAPFKPPPYVLPRDAGEETGGGLSDLNGLNVLNDYLFPRRNSGERNR
jgi:hypothetical protein